LHIFTFHGTKENKDAEDVPKTLMLFNITSLLRPQVAE